MFDIVLLRSFVAVAETRSFTSAGAELRMSQSAVSKHVRALEFSANAVLLDRDSREVSITEAGDAMLTFARRILATHDDATAYFSGRQPGSRLRIGAEPLVAITALPEMLRGFRQNFPDVTIDIRTGEGEELVAQVRSGQLDVVLVQQSSSPSARTVVRQRLAWVAHPELQLDERAPIPFVVIHGVYPSTMWVFRLLEDEDRSWLITCTAEDWAGVHAALCAGLGVAVLPERLIPPGAQQVSADWLPGLPEIQYALVDHPRTDRAWIRDLRVQARAALEPRAF